MGDEFALVQQLLESLRNTQDALDASTILDPQAYAERENLIEQLLATTQHGRQTTPELAAAVLELREMVNSLEHGLRIGMAAIKAQLEPQSQSSQGSFADQIGRGHSLGSA